MKNIIVIILSFTMIMSFSCINVFAANDNSSESIESTYYFDQNCTDMGSSLKIGALVIRLVRIAVPFIIIVMGVFKLLPAVLSGNPGDLTKSIKDIFMRVILAVLIFFTPSIINAFMKVMTPDENADVNVCRRCLFENQCPDSEDALNN